MEKYCRICNEFAVMRMQTTEYEDWYCKTHYTEAYQVLQKNRELQMGFMS